MSRSQVYRGRPRDPRTHDAIVRATLAVLVEVGYPDTSIGAIASRAHVGKDAIYRRWSSKPELVYDVVFTTVDAIPVPDTGTLLGDLTVIADALVTEFAAPAAVATLPGLLADFASDPHLRTRIRTDFLAPAKERLVGIFDRAAARGETPEKLPVDLVLESLAGTVFFHVGLVGETRTNDLAYRLASMVVKGIEVR